MSTYSQIHLHLVTAVKYRRALILPSWRDEMLCYQTGIIQKKGHKVIAINAMPDHLHLLIGKRPTESEASLMRDLKSDTSEWINRRRFCEVPFAWQDGYSVFSCTSDILPTVVHMYGTNRRITAEKAFARRSCRCSRKMKFHSIRSLCTRILFSCWLPVSQGEAARRVAAAVEGPLRVKGVA